MLVERVAHFGDRAHTVIREAIDDDRGAVDAVAFIANFFVVRPVHLARAALNRALDGLFSEIVVVGFINRQTQPRVAVQAAAAHARRDGDFFDQTGGNLPFFGILTTLAVLDVCPLTVTGHSAFSCAVRMPE